MAGATFQGMGQGVHIMQLLAQPGFLIIPIPFEQSHLSLHAVFYIFEALIWARQWLPMQTTPPYPLQRWDQSASVSLCVPSDFSGI